MPKSNSWNYEVSALAVKDDSWVMLDWLFADNEFLKGMLIY